MSPKIRDLILFHMVIMLVFLYHAIEASPAQQKGTRGDFKYYSWVAKRSIEQRLKDMEYIRWSDNVTQDERKALVSFFETQQSEVDLYRLSNILKADLDMTGYDEFIVNVVIKNPTKSKFGDVLCVLTKTATGFRFLFKFEPLRYHLTGRQIDVVDFDRDGFKDIVDQREGEAYGEVPPVNVLVYKNNAMKRFAVVYDKPAHDHLRFVDVDKDGRLELLEPVLAVKRGALFAPPTNLWINIYEWTGAAFVDRSERYLDFYRAKEAEYKELVEKYRLESSAIAKDMVSIYEEYLKKIEELKGHQR